MDCGANCFCGTESVTVIGAHTLGRMAWLISSQCQDTVLASLPPILQKDQLLKSVCICCNTTVQVVFCIAVYLSFISAPDEYTLYIYISGVHE